MQLIPYISTELGQIPLRETNAIKNGEKLCLILSVDQNDEKSQNIAQVELYNPFEKKVITGKIPSIDNTKIATLEVLIPDHWISGRYTADVLDTANNLIGGCHFYLTHKHAYQQLSSERSIKPNWRMHYRITIRNPTDKPIGNFSSFVALPMDIPPQQYIKQLEINPSNLKISTDIQGNQWVHYEVKLIAPQETIEMGYSAIIECHPLIISRNIKEIIKTNPYTPEFLEQYLNPEPHIESDHPSIVKIAESLKTTDSISFVKKATNLVNKQLTYKIQSGEFGAAYAIEKKEGDCTEYAALFVALCRAAGIPARTNAGFAKGEQWERHATAEFLVAGRWLPIDVTGQKGNDIFIGHLPGNIIVTRGNWMGGTLAKEVIYRYQILESNQKLLVDVDWKIAYTDKSVIRKKPTIAVVDRTVKIIESKITVSNKVKIIDNEPIITPKYQFSTRPSESIKSIKLTSQKYNKETSQPVSIICEIPDVLKDDQMRNQEIVLRNNSEEILRGCFEIRLIEDGIVKLLSYQGLKIPLKGEIKVKPKLQLDKVGSNQIQFVFQNRIGRVIAKEEKKITVF
ncbi:MAG: hypothetical protein JXA54_17025 [Candidatus Heimdallarchaeota archaeon]|nr:hypothetical protein [Candidatus Heimdallarchaeota archaeon]